MIMIKMCAHLSINIYAFRVQIALAECIWGCIAFYPSCLEKFLAQEGLFRLLDILEISAGPAAPVHLINCIIQLCEYPRCMDQLLYWERPMLSNDQRTVFGRDVDIETRGILRSKPKSGDCLQELAGKLDQSLASLLCQFWRDEESRYQVMRDPDGCIACKLLIMIIMTIMGYSVFPREKSLKSSAQYAFECDMT